MAAFNYVVLCHLLCTLSFQVGTLYKCSQMFRSKQLRANSTPTFILFFCYLTLVSFTAIPYCLYVLILWRPNEIIYIQRTMYLVGIFPWIFLISNPIFQFGLCLERCFIVAFPYRYLDKWKKAMQIFIFVSSLSVMTLVMWLDGFFWLPNDAFPACQYFSCVISLLPQKFMTIYKISIAVLEFIVSLILGALIKQKTKSIKGKTKNVVILVMVATTVVCELTPNIIDTIVYNITGLSMVNIIGPYRTTISSLNIFVSATLYTHVFTKSKDGISTIMISPPTMYSISRIRG